MQLRNNRDEIILATKYTAAWKLAHEDNIIQSNFGGNNKKSLHVSFEASLRKLQTTYIDIVCFLTFFPSNEDYCRQLANLKVISALRTYVGLYYQYSGTHAFPSFLSG